MTLATHIVIAAAVVKPLGIQSPALGFLIALASHYMSDAIPHWDYWLNSISPDDPAERRKFSFRGEFLGDFVKIALDGTAGTALALFLLHPASVSDWVLAAGLIVGSVLPDFLQGVYYTRRAEFLRPLQTFHDFMHTKIRLHFYPVIGIPFQIIIFLLSVYLTY